MNPVIELSNDVILMDIGDKLPRGHGAYPKRTKDLTTLFVHHSGADNKKDGFEAWEATAWYHILKKKWPGIAYQYAINHREILDDKGRAIIYRVGARDTVRNHTGGCNRFSEGLCLQGNLTLVKISEFQTRCLSAFIPWWCNVNGRSLEKDLGWHANAWKWLGRPKPACPGKSAIAWLKEFREQRSAAARPV